LFLSLGDGVVLLGLVRIILPLLVKITLTLHDVSHVRLQVLGVAFPAVFERKLD